MQINLNGFEKHIDVKNGAILFTKKGYKGMPDRVYEDHGFTLEFKKGEIVMIDIYKPEVAIPYLISEDRQLDNVFEET